MGSIKPRGDNCIAGRFIHFIIIEYSLGKLKEVVLKIENFLDRNLRINLHLNRVIIRKVSQGIDFLGYIQLPYWRVLRDKTKKRMFRKIKDKYQRVQIGMMNENLFNQSMASYLGVLKYCCSYKLKQKIFNFIN